MQKKYLKIFLAASMFVVSSIHSKPLSADDSWVVNDIRISGLQRVSAGSVFNVMPIAVGDRVDTYDLQITTKEIFKTGQFDDIQLGREAILLSSA